jgi:hypothetical protein
MPECAVHGLETPVTWVWRRREDGRNKEGRNDGGKEVEKE